MLGTKESLCFHTKTLVTSYLCTITTKNLVPMAIKQVGITLLALCALTFLIHNLLLIAGAIDLYYLPVATYVISRNQ